MPGLPFALSLWKTCAVYLVSAVLVARSVLFIAQTSLQYVRQLDRLLATVVRQLLEKGGHGTDAVAIWFGKTSFPPTLSFGSVQLTLFTAFVLLVMRFWASTTLVGILVLTLNVLEVLLPVLAAAYQAILRIWTNRRGRPGLCSAGALFFLIGFVAFEMVREPRPFGSPSLPLWFLACWGLLWIIGTRRYLNRHPAPPTCPNIFDAPTPAGPRPLLVSPLVPTCKRLASTILRLRSLSWLVFTISTGHSIVTLATVKCALMLSVSPSLLKSWWRHVLQATFGVPRNGLPDLASIAGQKCASMRRVLGALETWCRPVLNAILCILRNTFANLTSIAWNRLVKCKSKRPVLASEVWFHHALEVTFCASESSARHLFPHWTYIFEVPHFPHLRDPDAPRHHLDFQLVPPTILPPCTCETPPPVLSIPPAELNSLLLLILAECKCETPAPVPLEWHIALYDMVSRRQSEPEFDFVDQPDASSPRSFSSSGTSSASSESESQSESEEEDSSPEQNMIHRRRLARRSLIIFPSTPRALSPILEVSSAASSSAPSSVAASSAPSSPAGSSSPSSCGTVSAPASPSTTGPRRVDTFKARQAQGLFLSFSAGLKLPPAGRASQQEEFQTNAANMDSARNAGSGVPSATTLAEAPPKRLLPAFGEKDAPPARQDLVVFKFNSSTIRVERPCRPDCRDIYCSGECTYN
ncbi:hypothetical protein FB451DRAFT_1523069 [Mycena latifolia]|nr:hypothetical protein FB451DRAFT_1523069 [Mycena latifolia]